jgi:predicted nucleic acid-binding protein
VSFLVDASVWVAAALVDDPNQPAAGAVVESSERLGALDLTLFEVANVLGCKYAGPIEANRMCGVIVARCQRRLVRVDPELIASGLALADEYGLTAYDAAYVAAARRNGWTLVSTDIRDLVSKGLAVAPDAAV